MRNCLFKFLKAIFNDKPLKVVLGSGKVVLRFVEPTSENPSSSDSNNAGQELFFHVSAMYWSPYRPVFCRLLRTDVPPGEDAHRRRIYLKANCLNTNFDLLVCFLILALLTTNFVFSQPP